MTHRTWMGRLLDRVTTPAGDRTEWRDRLWVRLTLQTLPDRDGPSSLAGGEEVLLLGANVGPSARQLAPVVAESLPAPTPGPAAPPALPSAVGHARDSAAGRRDSAAGGDRPARPADPFAVSAGSGPGAELDSFAPVRVSGPAGVAPGNTPPSPPSPGATGATPPADPPDPDFAAAIPVDPAAVPVIPGLQPAALWAEVSWDGAASPSAGASSRPVETPPTFTDGEEPVADGLAGEVTFGAGGASASDVSLETTAAAAPGAPGHQTEPETARSSNVTVTPDPGAAGQPVRADAGLFRISGVPAPGEKLEVHYTLAAHGAGGTVSVERSVTLTNGAGPVAVAPGPALAGGQPQVFTILLREQPGVRPARASAMVCVAPAGERVGDSALFEAHRVGRSPEAFEALVRRHGPTVARVCQQVVGNRADAEDVAQYVFLKLSRWQVRFQGTLTGWLRTVSKNASLAFLRSRRRRLRREREAARPEVAGPAVADGLGEHLDAAIRQLPAPLEEAVRLRYLEGRSQEEAARIVGCPRGTLSRRAADGVRVLRELLEAERTLTS